MKQLRSKGAQAMNIQQYLNLIMNIQWKVWNNYGHNEMPLQDHLLLKKKLDSETEVHVMLSTVSTGKSCSALFGDSRVVAKKQNKTLTYFVWKYVFHSILPVS